MRDKHSVVLAGGRKGDNGDIRTDWYCSHCGEKNETIFSPADWSRILHLRAFQRGCIGCGKYTTVYLDYYGIYFTKEQLDAIELEIAQLEGMGVYFPDARKEEELHEHVES